MPATRLVFERQSDGIQCCYWVKKEDTVVATITHDKWCRDVIVRFAGRPPTEYSRFSPEAPWISRGVVVTRAKNFIRQQLGVK